MEEAASLASAPALPPSTQCGAASHLSRSVSGLLPFPTATSRISQTAGWSCRARLTYPNPPLINSFPISLGLRMEVRNRIIPVECAGFQVAG